MEECVLIVITNEQDADGFPIQTERRIPVFCEEKSVRYTEFYEAQRSGYQPRIILEVRSEDWELSASRENGRKQYATHVEYDGSDYEVIRYYKTDKAKVQLTLGDKMTRW